MNFPYSTDLWDHLKNTDKAVIMYGMGNGADKILRVCETYGIPVADFFASDGFVRGHSFHGKTVLSYSEVKKKYGADRMIVLLSFASSRPEVLELFDRVDGECELYAPDVPVCGETLFTMDFARAHRQELEQVYNILADEESKRIFREVIAYKISGRICHLKRAVSDRDTVYRDLLHAETIRYAADLGAYNGDTVRELILYAPRLLAVTAMEPDRRNFRKLKDFANSLSTPQITTVHAAAWSKSTTLSFADSGNRNAGAFALGKQIEVTALPLDELMEDAPVDYIKYDVEGAEKEALDGSSHILKTKKPRLLVSIYHRSEDLFSLPLQIDHINPHYRFYLRRYPYVPAWDLNLICI